MNALIISVPAGGPYFEGHFPGRPILPGVAELALAVDALAHERDQALELQGIAFARLRQLVFPGDRLELFAREPAPGRLRLELKRDGALVANAELLLGPLQPCPVPLRASARSGEQDRDIPGLDALLPHRAPMRFVSAIRGWDALGLDCDARIPHACALVSGGNASPFAAIEAAAQAAAAWEAASRWQDAGIAAPRIGYLVAMRDAVFFAATVPADADLQVSVRLAAAAPPLTHYLFEVHLQGRLLTRGMLATFLTGAPA